MEKKLAVFDMAGTTVDDRDEVYRVLRRAVERRGARFSDEEFQKWMGTEKRWAIKNLFKVGGVDADDALIDASFEWFLEELGRTYTANPPVPLPGVEQALGQLRSAGIKVALTTGFSRSIADLILGRMNWRLVGSPEEPSAAIIVDAVVCGDEVPAGRPEPHMIQAVMAQTGVGDVSEVISLGDTVVDVESARAAGVTAVGVTTGRLTAVDLQAAGADLVLGSAADLPDMLECVVGA